MQSLLSFADETAFEKAQAVVSNWQQSETCGGFKQLYSLIHSDECFHILRYCEVFLADRHLTISSSEFLTSL